MLHFTVVSDEFESSAEFNTLSIIEKSKKSSKPRNSRRIVSFHSNVVIRECIHVNNFTDEEWINTWYTPKEVAQMKIDTSLTVDLFRRGQVKANDPLHCARGLEGRLNATTRRRNKVQGWVSALEEQSLQRNEGVNEKSAVMIATAYIHATNQAAVEAQERGRQDYLEVTSAAFNRKTRNRKSPFSRVFGRRQNK